MLLGHWSSKASSQIKLFNVLYKNYITNLKKLGSLKPQGHVGLSVMKSLSIYDHIKSVQKHATTMQNNAKSAELKRSHFYIFW